MIATGSQTSQITPIWNKKPLTKSKDFSENLSLKLLSDVILPSLPGQADISWFIMSNFQSDEYPWKPNFSNHIKFILKTYNYNQFQNFWDFLMFYQISFSPQVKRFAIITYKHGIYELFHEFPNDLRLRILGN